MTALLADTFNHQTLRALSSPHVAFFWYPVLLCVLVACLGLSFAVMQRAKPEWLGRTPFVMGAAIVVTCSVGAALVIFTPHRHHSRFGWFLIPMLLVDIGLGIKMMWRNGRDSLPPRFGAGASTGG